MVLVRQDLRRLTRPAQVQPPVRLLPYFDAYLLGYRDRHHLIAAGKLKLVYRPQGSIVLSGGELLNADIPFRAQVAWYSYDNQELPLDSRSEGNTPPDLWTLVDLLMGADFSPGLDSDAGISWNPFPDASDGDGTSVEIDASLLPDDARDLSDAALGSAPARDDKGFQAARVPPQESDAGAVRRPLCEALVARVTGKPDR